MHTTDKWRTRRAALGAAAVCLATTVSATAIAAEETVTGTTLLPETVVTATGTQTPSAEVGSSISVITGAELERRQITFVSDGLRYIPGVAVSRTSGFGSLTDVRIRGAEANQTLVLIDGVKVNDPALSSQFDFGSLLTSDIERIEILRGPQSVLYGSDAVGGVVNIITKRGSGGPRVTASTEYGSFDTYQSTATVSGGSDLYDFALNGIFFDTDGVSAASEDNGNTEKDGNRNKTVQGQFGLRPADNLEIRLNGRYQNSNLDTDAFTNVAVDDPSFSNNIERFGQAQVKLDLLDKNWEHIFT
ncbi:MAG: TonB-dependent receptor plug domain-containing protein, partial [Pseudomonadota bacterium]